MRKRPSQSDSEEITNAKWVFYAYAMDLKGYSSNDNGEVKPLTCDVKFNSIQRLNIDTAKFYFTLFQKDTLNECYLKPLGLVGIMAVGNKLFTPIYHSVIFEREADSLVLKNMNTRNSLLLQKSYNDNSINSWLLAEAKRRVHK